MKYIYSSDIKHLAITDKFQIVQLNDFIDSKNYKNVIGIVKLPRNLVFIEEDEIERIHDWAGDIELLNLSGTKVKNFGLNGWEFSIAELCLSVSSESKYKQSFRAKFTDLLDIENTSEIYDISEEGINSAIERFIRLAKFKEFRIATVQIEKEDLEIENEILKNKLITLNSKIDKLRAILDDIIE